MHETSSNTSKYIRRTLADGKTVHKQQRTGEALERVFVLAEGIVSVTHVLE